MQPLLYVFIGICCGASVTCALFILKRAGALQRAHARLSQAEQAAAAAIAERDSERERRREQEASLQAISEKLRHAEQDNARLSEGRKAAEERLAAHKEDVATLQRENETRFENIANRLFSEKSADFKKMSAENLSNMLSPFAKDIAAFREKMELTFGDHTKEQFALKHEIKRIVDANEKITLQAENLANALKGDSKTQGNWGEMLLERVLEASELRKDEDYILQGAGMGLRDEESGRVQQPDVLIKLPDSKHLIIDAKVSLVAYEQFINADTPDARDLAQKAFVKSVRRHIADLAGKKYHFNDTLQSPDFVFMFLPSEGAYTLAVQSDMQLQSDAWHKGVVLSSPCTLFAMLRTSASLWTMDRQRQNATEIALQAGRLYDKIAGFAEDMSKLGNQMGTAQKTYDSAMNKLSDGTGNILKRTEDLRLLGAQAKKKIKMPAGSADIPLSPPDAKNA